jgi:hypothetical protein
MHPYEPHKNQIRKMNTKFTLLKTVLTLMFAVSALIASAQTSGPSDATSAPPVSASQVAQVLCPTATSISIKATAQAGYTYEWYKLDASGNPTLVQATTSSTYTETLPASNAAGYYKYELVMKNSATGCESPASDPFSIYVLPPLTVTITNNSATPLQLCDYAASSANPQLTANVTAANGQTYGYTYQWTEAGTAISGANSNTYTVTDRTVGTHSFNVNVGYALNSTCSTTSATTPAQVTIYAQPTKPTITVGP